jgi:surfactin synthase thioesterase subunit
VYRDWLGEFTDLDLVAARIPGREALISEPPLTDFASLIRYLLADLLPLTDVPFVLFGHSMGGLLAYELARRLSGIGTPPALLVVSGIEPPASVDIAGEYGETLDDNSLIRTMRRSGGTPEEVLANAELTRLLLPALRSDLRAVMSYEYVATTGPLGVPTRVYYGSDDEPDPGQLLEGWRIAVGAEASTAEASTAEVSAHEFTGGHFFPDTDRDAVIKTLGMHIDEAVPPEVTGSGRRHGEGRNS